MLRAAGGDPLKSRRNRSEMKKLIAAALIVCTTIAVVAVTIIRHVNNKQDAAWCHDHGYANYATKDGFCVGAGGKLFKIGRPHPPGLLSDPQANSRPQGLTVFLVVPSPTAVKPTQHLAVCYCPPIARVEYQSRAASARSHPESATAVRWSRGR